MSPCYSIALRSLSSTVDRSGSDDNHQPSRGRSIASSWLRRGDGLQAPLDLIAIMEFGRDRSLTCLFFPVGGRGWTLGGDPAPSSFPLGRELRSRRRGSSDASLGFVVPQRLTAAGGLLYTAPRRLSMLTIMRLTWTFGGHSAQFDHSSTMSTIDRSSAEP